jgi:hypothetical protein
MAEDNELEGQISDESGEQPTAENTPEGGEGSPPAQQEDSASKLREYEEKLARQEERNRYLESTNQLLERFSQQRQAPVHQQESSLSPELTELDRTLDPLFSKRMKSQFDPVVQQQSQLIDSNDALRFEMYLMRHNSDVLDNEDAYNRTMQTVEQIRTQAAQVYGKYLSRVDAYLYAQGLEGVKEKGKSKQSKKATQVKEEAKRQLQIQATKSGEGQPETKRVAGADVDAIRRRMLAGERLTADEKAKFRAHLANAKV